MRSPFSPDSAAFPGNLPRPLLFPMTCVDADGFTITRWRCGITYTLFIVCIVKTSCGCNYKKCFGHFWTTSCPKVPKYISYKCYALLTTQTSSNTKLSSQRQPFLRIFPTVLLKVSSDVQHFSGGSGMEKCNNMTAFGILANCLRRVRYIEDLAFIWFQEARSAKKRHAG